MNLDFTNKKLKNTIDTFLLKIAEDCSVKEALEVEDIKLIYKDFAKMCEELQSIDNNITETKLITTGEVILNELLKELNLDSNIISNARVKDVILSLVDELSDSKKTPDLYSAAITSLCVAGAISKLYLVNTSSFNQIDFREVENNYE